MYVVAFVFEATDSGGPYHHIYRTYEKITKKRQKTHKLFELVSHGPFYQLVKNLGHGGGIVPENISQPATTALLN